MSRAKVKQMEIIAPYALLFLIELIIQKTVDREGQDVQQLD
ncbi:hypothetical protein ACXYMX_16460 [Sporosarcina sp. CAU 1771]